MIRTAKRNLKNDSVPSAEIIMQPLGAFGNELFQQILIRDQEDNQRTYDYVRISGGTVRIHVHSDGKIGIYADDMDGSVQFGKRGAEITVENPSDACKEDKENTMRRLLALEIANDAHYSDNLRAATQIINRKSINSVKRALSNYGHHF